MLIKPYQAVLALIGFILAFVVGILINIFFISV